MAGYGFLEYKTKTHITYGWPRRIRCICNVFKRRLSSCHWNFKLYARDHAIVHLLYCFICWIHFLKRNKSTAKIENNLLITCIWSNKHIWKIEPLLAFWTKNIRELFHDVLITPKCFYAIKHSYSRIGQSWLLSFLHHIPTRSFARNFLQC